jgi:hypothetical protein
LKQKKQKKKKKKKKKRLDRTQKETTYACFKIGYVSSTSLEGFGKNLEEPK